MHLRILFFVLIFPALSWAGKINLPSVDHYADQLAMLGYRAMQMGHVSSSGPADNQKIAFSYTGGDQSWVVPAGVTRIRVKIWGSGGGGDTVNSSNGNSGGGGFTKCEIAVTPGETLTIIVGAGGKGAGYYTNAYGGGGQGWNGKNGGGRAAIRRGSTELVTAGGGGGRGNWSFSNTSWGTGGGLVGGSGVNSWGTTTGGTQTAGGTGGGTSGSQFQGGNAAPGGAGGGGGYYGGGGGADNLWGGGGSGYVGGCVADGSQSVTASTTNATQGTPSGTDDADYVSGIGSGGNNTDGGNGRIIITWMEVVLIGGKTSTACASAGGSVVAVTGGSICKFTSASCPSGWTGYLNYTATSASTCGNGVCNYNGYPGSCTTGSHAFSNTSRESCMFESSWLNSEGIWSCNQSFYSCGATITSIGCQ